MIDGSLRTRGHRMVHSGQGSLQRSRPTANPAPLPRVVRGELVGQIPLMIVYDLDRLDDAIETTRTLIGGQPCRHR